MTEVDAGVVRAGIGSRRAAIIGAAAASTVRIPFIIGWLPGQNPNGALIGYITQPMTIQGIIATVETPLLTAGTMSVYKAIGGVPIASGTVLHAGSFNANGPATTSQTLTVTTAALNAGERIGIVVTNQPNWLSGSASGQITVFATVNP